MAAIVTRRIFLGWSGFVGYGAHQLRRMMPPPKKLRGTAAGVYTFSGAAAGSTPGGGDIYSLTY